MAVAGSLSHFVHAGERMSLTTESRVQGTCVIVRVAGDYRSREEMFRVMEQLKASADEHGCTQAIMDLSAAQGRTSDMDRYYLGEHAAQVFRGLKVAVVFPAEGITKFGENVAVNRGARLAVVPSLEEAQRWLQKS